jgi:hypothetical protein
VGGRLPKDPLSLRLTRSVDGSGGRPVVTSVRRVVQKGGGTPARSLARSRSPPGGQRSRLADPHEDERSDGQGVPHVGLPGDRGLAPSDERRRTWLHVCMFGGVGCAGSASRQQDRSTEDGASHRCLGLPPPIPGSAPTAREDHEAASVRLLGTPARRGPARASFRRHADEQAIVRGVRALVGPFSGWAAL